MQVCILVSEFIFIQHTLTNRAFFGHQLYLTFLVILSRDKKNWPVFEKIKRMSEIQTKMKHHSTVKSLKKALISKFNQTKNNASLNKYVHNIAECIKIPC